MLNEKSPIGEITTGLSCFLLGLGLNLTPDLVHLTVENLNMLHYF